MLLYQLNQSIFIALMFYRDFTQVKNYECNYNGFIEIKERDMKSKIKKGLKITLLVIVVFFTVVAVINTAPFDQELKPEVIELMRKPAYPEIKDNAYFALMGINAAENKNIIEVGNQLIQRHMANRNNNDDALNDSDYEEILGLNKNSVANWMNDYSPCQRRINFDCLTSQDNDIFKNIYSRQRFQLMLKRYQEIIGMKIYNNFSDWSLGTPFPPYGSLSRISDIHLTYLYRNDSSHEFLLNLNRDQKFWKNMLTNGTMVLDKMVAISKIKINISYLSEYIRKNKINDEDLLLINEMLIPLLTKQLNLSASFKNESRSMLLFNHSIEKEMTFYDNLFYQPNASSNYLYENTIKRQLYWCNLPMDEFIELRKSVKELQPASKLQLHYLYNFIGKTLLDYSAGASAVGDYVGRGFDTNNMIKMVQIQLQHKLSKNIGMTEMLSKQENSNPYDGKSFNFDNQNGILSFECLDTFKKCEIKINSD